MGTIIAVGGGEIGRIKINPDGTKEQTPIETTLIDDYIAKATGKEHPNLLFLGTATKDSANYFNIIKEHFVTRIGCASVTELKLVEEHPSLEETKNKILATDIIYVGGGDTTFMLQVWKNYNLKEILLEAYQQGIVLAGISAGAICWFDWYDNMDDITDINELNFLEGLGFIKDFGVPHYDWLSDDEKSRINKMLKERQLTGYAMEDCTAIIYQDGKISTLSCRPDRKVIKL